MSEEVSVRQESGAYDAPTEARVGFWLDRMMRAFAQPGVPY
jgi:hypothetical protein